jgi:hypothetical protein
MPPRAKPTWNYQLQYDVALCTESNGFIPSAWMNEESAGCDPFFFESF